MSTNATRQVLSEAARFGRAHRSYTEAAETWRADRRDAATALVNGELASNGSLFDEPEPADEETYDLPEESVEYLVDGTDVYDIPEALKVHLDSLQPKLTLLTQSAEALLAEKRGELNMQQHTLNEALRTWVRSGSVEDWPEVLESWRRESRLPVRRAAEILGVSASAITRYESGSRSPSEPQMRGMVNSIIEWDPIASKYHALLGWYQQFVGRERFDDGIAQRLLEPEMDPRGVLLDELEELLDEADVGLTELRFLLELVRTPKLLSDLQAVGQRLAAISANPAEEQR